MKTVVGLYESVAAATKVKAILTSQGIDAGQIKVVDQSNGGDAGSSTDSTSLTTKVKDFFGGFSGHNDEHAEYSKSIGGGNVMLAVTVPDEQAEETADLLYGNGATGVQGGEGAEDVATLTGNSGVATTPNSVVSGEQVIPVVQEELVVGKRQVDRGGVRIYSHLVETAASADVTLRNERVVIDRQAVNRPATDADFATGNDVLELKATGEEAVVGKTSRVVEEVRVGKQASDHTEQINETVRHTEVDVEPVTTTSTETLTGTKSRY